MGNFFYRNAICGEYCTNDESDEYIPRRERSDAIYHDDMRVLYGTESVELDILDLDDYDSISSFDSCNGRVIECEFSDDEIELGIIDE